MLEHIVSLARCDAGERDFFCACVKAANAWLIINQYSAAWEAGGCTRPGAFETSATVKANTRSFVETVKPNTLNTSNPLYKQHNSWAQTKLYRCTCACMHGGFFPFLHMMWCVYAYVSVCIWLEWFVRVKGNNGHHLSATKWRSIDVE